MRLPIRLPAKLTQTAGKILLKAKAASPEACVIAGIVLGGTAVVMTGIKTWKSKDILTNDAEVLKNTRDNLKAARNDDDEELIADEKTEVRKATKTLAKDICKTYWIPVVLGVSSVGLVWGGRTLLRKELSAVTSAYALLMESYKQYRERVIADAGIEKDQEYMHGLKIADAIDSETGEVTKKIIKQGKSISPYSAWFIEGEYDRETGEWLWRNGMWKDSPLCNENTLTVVQSAANDQLRADGFLFLNDVRKMLCLPPTREGQIVGWTLYGGDGFVDFGVFPSKYRPMEKILPVNRLFLEHKTPNALLDFNVDGPILGALDATFGKDYANKLVSKTGW